MDRDTVRSIMREQGLVAAQPRRKDPAPPSRPRTWARVPTWSSGTSPPASRDEVGGRYHVYPHLRGVRVPGDRPRLLHQENSRVRDWGDSTRHQSWSARRSTWRPAGARRGEGRRSSTPRPRQPVHLHPARRPPERLRHSSFGGQDRGVLGGCLGGSRRARPSRNERAHTNGVPHETQGHQRYCLPGSSLVYKSDASSLGARVPDAGRGRTRFCKQ